MMPTVARIVVVAFAAAVIMFDLMVIVAVVLGFVLAFVIIVDASDEVPVDVRGAGGFLQAINRSFYPGFIISLRRFIRRERGHSEK